MSALIERAEQFLLAQTEPLIMGDVCVGVGVTRGASAYLARKLAEHLGAKLICVTRREPASNGSMQRRTYYSIVGASIKPGTTRGLTIPRDLWRGWRNPHTGIRGARLGLDEK